MTDTPTSRRGVMIGGAAVGAAVLGLFGPAMCAKVRMDRGSPLPSGAAPQRPQGKSKPMIDEDIAPVLARLDAWYAANLRPDKYRFNPPATDAQIDALERLVGVQLPSAYRQLYRWHDGENNDRWGHIYGLPILPLKQVAEHWTQWNRTLAELGGNRYLIPGSSWPEGAIDPAYVNPRWIPLTADGSSDHIGIDFDPWPRGRVGQVILFGRNEEVKAVLAPSLGTFLGWIADLLESGNFLVDPEPGVQQLREFRLKQPESDGFHDGARKLLGAPSQFP
ncbi:SMI1/KNR4 family protein [Sphingomonas xanthus]|uniref:Knr4/Smi1-like domain-containing protein n=1 Tax=Sphingomonas xanthus TaxID=2594473 RepID=A0A516IS28_9SPHN|nr:SMI1/KNR4 family protein [Sphingomonas xanthus]QDP19717.1 hypothetical protein FMM02_06950 [Sphingomonas xanthus]